MNSNQKDVYSIKVQTLKMRQIKRRDRIIGIGNFATYKFLILIDGICPNKKLIKY